MPAPEQRNPDPRCASGVHPHVLPTTPISVNNSQLDPRLVETVSRVLSVDPASITSDTSPRNTAAWDSVAHINLVLELEDVFGVRFASEEIPTLDSVAKLQVAIGRSDAARA